MKFLIVDDSRLVRMKLKAELCDRGHSVVEARDGEEALARVDADAPDAVFLDLILPKLDERLDVEGLQKCKQAGLLS